MMSFRESDVALPIKLDAIAVIQVRRRKAKPSIGRLYLGAIKRVGDTRDILERAIKECEMRLAAREKLLRLLLTLVRGGNTRENGKIIAGEKQGRIGVTNHRVQSECVRQINTQFR